MKKVVLLFVGALLSSFFVPTGARTAEPIPQLSRQRDVFSSFSLSQPSSATSFVEGEVLVKFKKSKIDVAKADGAGKVTSFVRAQGAITKSRLNPENSILMKSTTKTTAELITFLQLNPAVEYVEPNFIRHLAATPDDTNYSSLWGMNNTGQTVNGTAGTADADIDAPEAWNVSTGSTAVTVAVIDSGIASGHPDLTSNLVAGYDFVSSDSTPEDLNDHGTHVAGSISAAGNNAAGVTGVNWNVKIMPLRVADASGSIIGSNFILALNYAVAQGVKIVNYSAGGTTYSQAEYDAIANARSSGVLIMAAAGNGGGDGISDNNDAGTHYYPSDYALDNIISVAATDQNDALASFSNYGSTSVDVGAPGVNIYSTVPYRPFTENFSGATLPSFTGTQFTSSGSNNYWLTASVDVAAWGGTPTSYQANSNGVLTSSSLNTAGDDVVKLQYDYAVESQDTGACATDYLLVQVYNGSVWTEVERYCGTGTSGTETLDISAYKSTVMQVSFQWITDGSGNSCSGPYSPNCLGAGIDNVKILTPNAVNGSYDFMQGTSMATPHVTGLAALLKSYKSTFTYLGLRNAILNNVDAVAGLSGVVVTGGRINAYNSLANVDGTAPTATISYSTTAATNQSVVATLVPSETVVVTNNSASLTHTFTANGSFEFTFTDLAGNAGTATATVSNIDATAPVITIAPYTTTPTNQDITVTATTNEGTLNAASHVFTANGSFDFVATDTVGNATTSTVTITNIDKTAPVIKTIKLTKGAYTHKLNGKKITIRPFGTDYAGTVWARSVTFKLDGTIFIFINSGAYKKGQVKVYKSDGKLLKAYNPFGGFATNGLNTAAVVDTDKKMYLAVGATKAGTTVIAYHVAATGLTKLGTLKAATKAGNILVGFQKLYSGQYGLTTKLFGDNKSIKVWKFNLTTNKFVEDKKIKKTKIKL